MHELAHLKNNDLLERDKGFVLAVTQIATMIFLNQFLSLSVYTKTFSEFLINLGGTMAAGYLGLGAMMLKKCYDEKQADLFSVRTLGNDAREGGIQFFQALQIGNKSYRNQENLSWFERFKRRLRYSPEGDDRLDLGHPFLSTRIRTLSQLHLFDSAET